MASKPGFKVCGLALLVAGCSANARFDLSEFQDQNSQRAANGTSTASLPAQQTYGYSPSYPPAAYPSNTQPANASWANPTNTASITPQRSYSYTPSYPPAAAQPTTSRAPASTASLGWSANRPETGMTTNIHVVREGETLWGISKRYDVPVAQLYSANGLLNDKLTPGQHLAIPTRGSTGSAKYASN